jgi:hypothetical protein
MLHHSMIHRVFVAVLLLGLLVTPPGSSFPAVEAQTGGTRSQDWVQSSVADFDPGQLAWTVITDVEGGELRLSPGAIAGTYVSPVIAAEFPFNAIAPRWHARVPPGASISVELRVYAEDGWSTWLPVHETDWTTEQDVFYPEVPLLTWNGQQFQYRVTMGASPVGASPVLEAMTITYIDSTPGPTMAEALGMATQGGIAAQDVPQPTVISRAGWGADESYRYDGDGDLIWPLEYQAVEKIVVHHTLTTNDYTDGPYWVRAVYYYHAVTRGWGDIGYNYLVDRFGNIYEGRYGGPDIVAGHTYGYNYGSMGVSVIGSYTNTVPTADSLASLTELTAWEANRSYIHPLESSFFVDTVSPNIAGHRDYRSTDCPGDVLYAELPAVRQGVWDRIVAEEDQYHVDWLAWDVLPSAICANGTYSVNIAIRNTGWYTYVHAGPTNSVRIGYHWYDSNGERIVQPEEDDHRGGLPYDVTFGHVYTFTPALVTTPITPGTYTLEWDMVHEGVDWFHDANPASPVLTMTFWVTNCVSLASEGQSVQENAGTVVVPVQLSVVSDVAVNVPFTLSGTAAEGALLDYTTTSSPVTIPPGEMGAEILIAVNDDALDEHDETVVVTLGTPSSAVLGATAVHTATIVDNDDPPAASFALASQSESETAGTMTVTLQLDAASGLTATVPYSLSGTATDGGLEDYTVTPSPVTIPPGETGADILIAVHNDGLDEDDETVILTLSAPDNATLGATAVHTATILDPLRVSGHVLDIYGQAVSGGQVVAQSGVSATTDASGAYALYLAPYGTYTVAASAQGHAPLPSAYGIDGTRDHMTYSFVLAPSNVVNTFEDGQLEGDFDSFGRGGIAASPPAPTSTAHTGLGAAEMSVATPGARTWLSQSVALPAEQISPTLSFLYQVPTVGDGSRFQITLAATSTLSYTIPLAVSEWAHYSVPLPPEINGDVDVTFELVQSTAITPTTVLLDEVVVGYQPEPHKVFLPLVIRSTQAEWWSRPSTDGE